MRHEPIPDIADELHALGPERDWPPLPDHALEGGSLRATPYVYRDPSRIPPRAWLYDRRLIRGFLSTTVAPGGIGKSSLELVEAVALASGRPLLGVPVGGPYRVWYWCGEDPIEEIERRVAGILLHYRISPAEIDGRLFLDSGRTSEIVIAETTKTGSKLAQPMLAALSATIEANSIDLVVLDPFISTHRVAENDNSAVDMVAKALNRVAERCGCAFSLVHHVRKGIGTPGNTSVEDGRGAGSLLAAARSARVLNQMTKEEAERAGVDNPFLHFRVDNGKANLAPRSDRSTWYRLASVSLGNGPESAFDLSDHVAVVEPWEWPNALDSITVADLRRAQQVVSEGRWRESVQANDWVGIPIAKALGIELDKAGKAKVGGLLKTWVANGMFVAVTGMDEKSRPRSFIEVGEPASD